MNSAFSGSHPNSTAPPCLMSCNPGVGVGGALWNTYSYSAGSESPLSCCLESQGWRCPATGWSPRCRGQGCCWIARHLAEFLHEKATPMSKLAISSKLLWSMHMLLHILPSVQRWQRANETPWNCSGAVESELMDSSMEELGFLCIGSLNNEWPEFRNLGPWEDNALVM